MARRRGKKARKPVGAPAAPASGYRIRGWARPYLLSLLSAVMLTLAFPSVVWFIPGEVSWAAYFAPVPLLVLAVSGRSRRQVFRAAYVGGLVFFGVNLHWVAPITVAGFLALVPYLALYWAVFAWGVRRIGEAVRVPLTLLAPALWVALEYLRGWFLTGLPWLFVGHTQYENLTLIQTADALGVYGPSFLVLMTAGLVTEGLTRPIFVKPAGGVRPRVSRSLLAVAALTALVWAGTIAYGVWRLGQAAARPGPFVASVQTNVPQEVKLGARRADIERLEHQMLDAQLRLSDQAVAAARSQGERLDLLVWPETMVPGLMNRSFLESDLSVLGDDRAAQMVFGSRQSRSRSYWLKIRDLAARAEAPILFGANALDLEGVARVPGGGIMPRGPRRNAAFLVGPDSKPYAQEHAYVKVHLVPFGEYVPFKKSWPWLHALLHGFTPYRGMDYSLTPGDRHAAPFRIRYAGGEARFQVAICYEDAMPYRIREMARPPGNAGRKAIDFLVNISNDGWFGGSVELDQHLNLCVFRAVENRIAVVRSVNTGISAVIDPVGRIQRVVADAEGRRRNIEGWIVGRLALDGRVAPYTVVGDAFARVCLGGAALVVIAGVLRDLQRRKGRTREASGRRSDGGASGRRLRGPDVAGR